MNQGQTAVSLWDNVLSWADAPDRLFKRILARQVLVRIPDDREHARKEIVHAKDLRSAASAFRPETGQRQIARSVRISESTVHDYLARFGQSGLNGESLQVEIRDRFREELASGGRRAARRRDLGR